MRAFINYDTFRARVFNKQEKVNDTEHYHKCSYDDNTSSPITVIFPDNCFVYLGTYDVTNISV
jgi:hypothetical protein